MARRRGWLFILGLGAVLAAALVLWFVWRKAPEPAAARGRGGGVPPVTVAAVAQGELPVTLGALGTVTPLSVVTVRPQLSGQLVEVAFKEGQPVKAGDLLAQVDPRPYELSLAQYQGQLRRDQALLTDARLNLERYRTLVAQDSISRQQLTTQEALVQQYEGAVISDNALIDTARLNLTYARITAPVGGRAGLRQVDPGNYVQAGQATGIVTITQMQPISVIFTLPEDALPVLRARLRAGADLPVTAFDRAGAGRLAEGKLVTIDNAIDTGTGTVKLRAIFDNADEALFPNQFVNISLGLETKGDAILIPSAALSQGAVGPFVYVLGEGDKVAARPVTLGPAAGPVQSVTAGLRPGEKVVTDGLDKLRDGMAVTVAPAAASPGGGGRGREPLAPVHPAARRHDATDGGHPAGGDRGLPAATFAGVFLLDMIPYTLVWRNRKSAGGHRACKPPAP